MWFCQKVNCQRFFTSEVNTDSLSKLKVLNFLPVQWKFVTKKSWQNPDLVVTKITKSGFCQYFFMNSFLKNKSSDCGLSDRGFVKIQVLFLRIIKPRNRLLFSIDTWKRMATKMNVYVFSDLIFSKREKTFFILSFTSKY